MSLKLSVITVVLNDSDRVADTIESVLSQDYENIEYIIKDGCSTDGTIDIIKQYAQNNDRIVYISEPDKGIYDAMNMALMRATGDVVGFLNAGDRYVSADVVLHALSVMEDTRSDIVYGDVLYENPDGSTDIRSYPQSCSRKIYYLTGDCINHQVMFFQRELFKDNLFDTSFKICADREWMIRTGAYSPHCKMTALGFTVAAYPLDGASIINKDLYNREASLCVRRHLPLGYPIFAVFSFFRSNTVMRSVLHNIYKSLYINSNK